MKNSYTPKTNYIEFLSNEIIKHSQLKVDDIIELTKRAKELNLPIRSKEIIMFLHSAKFNVDKAQRFMTNNYKQRKNLSQFFSTKDPMSLEMKQVHETMGFSITLMNNNECHIYAQLKDTDNSKFNFVSTIRYLFMVIEYVMITQGTVENIVFTFNANGIGLFHLNKINMDLAQQLMMFLKGSLPVRMKGIYIVNSWSFIAKIINSLTSFASSSIKDKVKFVEGEELKNYTSIDHIPSEIQGNDKSHVILSEITYKNLCSYRDWYTRKQNIKEEIKHT
ncbi:uncharacterized protein LOC126897930 isoform X2 [Daktulosphaira vitifoliae]|uniref:uncharacterized protein LOC126897930 isoform X2 n=1 Tax=Daktulosphaira vitifoliae TaxID=58002 RepID=UPI0021AAB8A0|nr:uncharacterized protein LOC126897930 isoform X2 [Daktulosphaira vitifoliae]